MENILQNIELIQQRITKACANSLAITPVPKVAQLYRTLFSTTILLAI